MNERLKDSIIPRGIEIPVYLVGGMLGGITDGAGGAVVAAATVYGLSAFGKYLNTFDCSYEEISKIRQGLNSKRDVLAHSLDYILAVDVRNLRDKLFVK